MTQRPVRTQPHLHEPPPDSGAGTPPDPSGPSAGRGLVYQTPVVTFTLIAVNVAMWVLTSALAPRSWLLPTDQAGQMVLVLLGGKVGPLIRNGEWWRLVTAMFLHGGLIHLAVNMWALLQLGTLCEIVYGRVRFLILYVCAGVLGNIASYEMSPELGVGASGAIWGLFGVAIVFSLKYRRELPGQMGDRLLRSLVPVLFLNLALTFAIPIIDKSAHLGGLIAGALLAAITESRMTSPQRRQQELLPVPAALLTAVGLLLYGAWGLGSRLPTAKPDLLANLAVQRNRTHQAIGILQQALVRHPNDLVARELLMELLLMDHRWQEAADQYLALSRSSLPTRAKLMLGFEIEDELYRARQASPLERVYQRLLELHPDDPVLINEIAYPYADLVGTHLGEAERLVQKALEERPDEGNIVDTLAWIYYKEGKLKDAYASQQRAIRLESSQPELRYHMGVIEEAMGHLPAAREEYGMALRLDPKLQEARQALARLQIRAPTSPPPSGAPQPSREPTPAGGRAPQAPTPPTAR